MSWDVVFTDQFGEWWDDLSMEQQEALYARVQVLMQLGPDLGRPVVDAIEGSKHGNMKELRASQDGALRVLFVFDPTRRATARRRQDRSVA